MQEKSELWEVNLEFWEKNESEGKKLYISIQILYLTIMPFFS